MSVIDRSGTPPEKGSPAWDALVAKAVDAIKGTPCCANGGRTTSGWPCESTYLMPNGKCRMHGGASLVGPAHPRYTHGRTSKINKVLPAKYREAYAAAVHDDQLLSLRNEIALGDARAHELLERLSTRESGEAWKDLWNVLVGLEAALTGPDDKVDLAKGRALTQRAKAITVDARNEERTWHELRAAFEHRGELVDKERKRLETLGTMLTAEQGMSIMDRLVDILLEVFERGEVNRVIQKMQTEGLMPGHPKHDEDWRAAS